MARALSSTNTRLVLTGPEAGPDKCWGEYTVDVDGLKEEPKRLDFESPDFDTNSNSFWTARMGDVNTAESI